MRVLITGGGTGVGADLARGFAAASYDVVVAGRTRESLLAIPNATPVVADVTDEDSVAAMFAESGRCDVVIANAGAALSAPVKATSKADWDQM
ncbi:MAG TPA: SDR family oxidoreductase, partial [Marmoricola sp.]|nr:SDR family oxidoreductase [Marmoricola sp.]